MPHLALVKSAQVQPPGQQSQSLIPGPRFLVLPFSQGENVKVIIGALVAILFIDLCSLWFQSSGTSVAVVPEVKTIGGRTPVEVQAINPHGVRRLTAWIEQGGSRFQVFQQQSPGHWWRWPHDQPPTRAHFETGKDTLPALKEGKARLVVEAVGDDFRGASARNSYDINVVPAPPQLSRDGTPHPAN